MSDLELETREEPEAAATATVEAPIALGGGSNGHSYDELAGAAAVIAAAGEADLSLVFDLPVELAVEIGRTTMTIRETLAIAPGTLIQLNRLAGEPVDLLVNGHMIAKGEVVAIDEEFGFRVTEIVSPSGDE